MRRDTRLSSRERDETRFLDFFSLNYEIYRENFFVQLKYIKCKKMVHFEMNLYYMKLNFYFNELYAVLTTCKLELHDSGSIENHYFFYKLEIMILKKKKKIRNLNKIM